MKKLSLISWMLLLVILLTAFVGLSVAQENPNTSTSNLTQLPGTEEALTLLPAAGQSKSELIDSSAELALDQLDLHVAVPLQPSNVLPDAGDDSCFQLLANPTLDVVEFGDGSGIAEPWVIFDPVVYYSTIDFISPAYSLILWDADSMDITPGQDAFAQGFFMPQNLTKLRIEYNTATLNTNTTDKTSGNIFTLNNDGTINQKVFGWSVNDSDGEWQGRFVETVDKSDLQSMQGKALAIILFSTTNGSAPGEEVFFDDITIVACSKSAPPASGKVFLPNIFNNFGKPSGPICLPPTENPQDQYNANRGTVQTGAVCKTSLSEFDRADYYAFTPSKSGNHTLNLTNLPPNTEWSAMMFFDIPSPKYVDGPTGGDCRIGTTGSGNKSVTCNLQKNVPIIVKVSAGSTPILGDYTMKITSP